MTAMKIEAGKTYLTRNGRKAIVYATNGAGRYPVHGALDEDVYAWCLNGRSYTGTEQLDPDDLVEEWIELTQEQKDEKAFDEWLNDPTDNRDRIEAWRTAAKAWLAACRYARGE